MTRHLAAVALAVSLLACGGEELVHQVDDAQERIELLREEVDSHATAADTAHSLSSLQGLETPHQERVRLHMDELGHAIRDMGACDGVPDRSVDAMMDGYESCGQEFGRHEGSIAAAASLDAARLEEQHHRSEMMARLDDLDDMMDDMMDGHGTMMCRGHHGMDDHDRQ